MALSSNSTLSDQSAKSLPAVKMNILSTIGQNSHEMPPSPNHGQAYDHEGALPSRNWHLPSTSTKIKSWPLQLLTFNTPERSSGLKSGMRHSVLWEKMGRAGLQILRFFSGEDFYESQFLHLRLPRGTLTSLMVTSALVITENITIKSQNRVAMFQISKEITRWPYGCNFILVLVLQRTWSELCQTWMPQSQNNVSCS